MAEWLAVLGIGPKTTVKNQADASDDDHANIAPRLLAYALDSVALFAFAMLFATISFLNIFLRSDKSNHSTTDGAVWVSVAILLATVPAWLILNLIMGRKRGQTLGQYVMGLRNLSEDDAQPGIARLLLYWLALHPLLFHPLIAFSWLLLAYVSISLSGSPVLLILGLAAALLCLVAPLLGLLFLVTDPQRRALHDRIAGVKVVRLQ